MSWKKIFDAVKFVVAAGIWSATIVLVGYHMYTSNQDGNAGRDEYRENRTAYGTDDFNPELEWPNHLEHGGPFFFTTEFGLECVEYHRANYGLGLSCNWGKYNAEQQVN